MTKAQVLFGFLQLDLPGTLAVAEGRYVIRDGDIERVLVLQTLGAPPPPRRRRRRPRETSADALPPPLPLTRATVVRAFEPFEGEAAASAWLQSSIASEEAIDALLDEALAVLNHTLHTHAVVSGDTHAQALTARHAAAARVGYGTGQEVAVSDFTDAREVEARAGVAPKRRRQDELRPQERIAAVLGDRERMDPCEPILLRARADLDVGRVREAALQTRVGVEALLAEFTAPPAGPDHEEDMATLRARAGEAQDLATRALAGDLDTRQVDQLADLLGIAERVIRRRRVLRG